VSGTLCGSAAVEKLATDAGGTAKRLAVAVPSTRT
jgi:hypothetical protein